jgi:hypothetical protein
MKSHWIDRAAQCSMSFDEVNCCLKSAPPPATADKCGVRREKNNFSSGIGKAQKERAPAALLIFICGMVPEVGVEPTRF